MSEETTEAPVETPAPAEAVALGDKLLKSTEKNGDLYLCVSKENLLDALRTLKESADLQYTFFSECVGVDYSTWTHERDLDGRFEVIYNLISVKLNRRVFVKTSVNDGESIPTAKHIFLGAEYPEKEIGDMYGIVFAGNGLAPGSRFMLPDDWVGFPLRKEYPLGGEDVLFDKGDRGPAVEDKQSPHAGESFEGKTGTQDVSGR
ncbi:MAG: NADH-quinone oxidoreductase subunit C [Armatimonadetes bacterium]|nr:NADH-quinone oxidoreductase subunit C [Armatimonadota bacterium]